MHAGDVARGCERAPLFSPVSSPISAARASGSNQLPTFERAVIWQPFYVREILRSVRPFVRRLGTRSRTRTNFYETKSKNSPPINAPTGTAPRAVRKLCFCWCGNYTCRVVSVEFCTIHNCGGQIAREQSTKLVRFLPRLFLIARKRHGNSESSPPQDISRDILDRLFPRWSSKFVP